MTSMTRGSLSSSVYWRRRLVVLTVAAVLLVLVRHLVGGGDATQPTARQVSALPTITTHPHAHRAGGHRSGASATTAGPGMPTGSGAARNQTDLAASDVEQPALAAPTGMCADDDVLVTPQVADAEVGQPVPLTLLLRTRTAAACTWRVSANHLALKVTRLHHEIWSSRLCPQQVPTTDVVVRQAADSTLQVSWDARRAEEGCPRVSAWALPGHYQIDAAALGGVPARSTFALSPRTVTVTAPPAKHRVSGDRAHHHDQQGQQKDQQQGQQQGQ